MKKATATPESNGSQATGAKIANYRKSRAVKLLEDMANADDRQRMPEVPYLAPRTFRDDSANGLTKCITAFLKLSGHAASRINNTGIPVDTRKSFFDVLGNQRQIGSISWRNGN